MYLFSAALITSRAPSLWSACRRQSPYDVHALGKIGVLHLRTSEVVHLQAVVCSADVHLSVAYEDAHALLSLGTVHVGRLDEARLLVRLAQTRLAAVVDSVLVHRQ